MDVEECMRDALYDTQCVSWCWQLGVKGVFKKYSILAKVLDCMRLILTVGDVDFWNYDTLDCVLYDMMRYTIQNLTWYCTHRSYRMASELLRDGQSNRLYSTEARWVCGHVWAIYAKQCTIQLHEIA